MSSRWWCIAAPFLWMSAHSRAHAFGTLAILSSLVVSSRWRRKVGFVCSLLLIFMQNERGESKGNSCSSMGIHDVVLHFTPGSLASSELRLTSQSLSSHNTLELFSYASITEQPGVCSTSNQPVVLQDKQPAIRSARMLSERWRVDVLSLERTCCKSCQLRDWCVELSIVG